ncbi:hypothetical protein P8936_08835 [Edaphobacter paludis]|uniref:Secreted protein n=1 Tax=Edaphobacter paludis TaxID=3035702 RepID=A0AAU7D4K4_9BACT
MKSFLGLLLMVAAPLAAQTPTPRTIIFKVVLTTAPSSPIQPPTGDPGLPPVTVGDPSGGSSTGPITNPGSGSTTSPPASCDGYSNAISAMNHVYANLLYTQQIYTAAETANPANASTYTINNNTLVGMQLYSQDIRDIIRIGGPKDMLTQDVATMSTKVAKLPTLLGNNPKLPLASLVADMQASLTNVRQLVLASSCSESLP